MPTPAANLSSETTPGVPARADWVRVDCGGPGAASSLLRVGGVPLVSRTLRLAARAGYRGAVLAGGERAELVAALARFPAPAGFAVEHEAEGPGQAGPRVTLAGNAVYAADELPRAAADDRPPRPLRTVASRDDARAATSELIRRTRKSIDADGVVAYYLFRPLSRAMSRLLVGTRVSPNMVSATAMLCGIAAAICAAVGGYQLVVLAGALYWLGAVIDCVDGELARVRLQSSRLGEWLDSLADEVSTYGLLAGLGIGMVRDGHPEWWAWMTCIAGATGFLLNLKLMIDLHRAGRSVDTAAYPWFFGTPSKGEAKSSGWGKVIYALNFLVRRDAVVTMIAIALALNARVPAVIGFMVGLGSFTLMFFVHGVVVSRRRQPDEPSFWAVGYFGVKDLFTMVNLLGGVFGIYFATQGDIRWAGYAIFIGYLGGDALDGQVARWTGTSNRFGSEFDAASDGVAQAAAPAVIVYAAYAQLGHPHLGLALMAALFASSTIRQARFAVASFNYPLTYCGLPRTVSGLIAVSLPNTVLFFDSPATGHYGSAAFLFFVAVLNLLPIPYMTHKGRRLQGHVRFLVGVFLVVPPVMIIVAPEFVFDVLFVITFGYAMGAWAPLTPQERREFWAEYRRWSREVERRR